MSRAASWPIAACALALCALPVAAAEAPPGAPGAVTEPAAPAAPATRNGREIYSRFRAGLADPTCTPAPGAHWQRQFANAPRQLAARNSDALALFGYVVDALREASLPTEYALIPFVESGYRPGARSGSGPAGLWQFVALTARHHAIAIRPGYDGRLSAVDSTQAAVRYLKTLHGQFAGDWRLTVMAFNTGESRVSDALARSGQQAAGVRIERLVGLSAATQGYVGKLHALACVLDLADDREAWLRALDRPVAALAPAAIPAGTRSLDAWAGSNGIDAALLKRLNPAFPDGRIERAGGDLRILAPSTLADPSSTRALPSRASAEVTPASMPVTTLADAGTDDDAPVRSGPARKFSTAASAARTHTVARGDSIWRIARRYGVRREDLVARNRLAANGSLHPGMVLKIDAVP